MRVAEEDLRSKIEKLLALRVCDDKRWPIKRTMSKENDLTKLTFRVLSAAKFRVSPEMIETFRSYSPIRLLHE